MSINEQALFAQFVDDASAAFAETLSVVFCAGFPHPFTSALNFGVLVVGGKPDAVNVVNEHDSFTIGLVWKREGVDGTSHGLPFVDREWNGRTVHHTILT